MWILGLKGLPMTQRGYRRIYDCQEVEFSGFELCSYLKVSAFAVVKRDAKFETRYLIGVPFINARSVSWTSRQSFPV